MYKQSPKKIILNIAILISIVTILVIAKYTSKDFKKQELTQESFFAIYINDEKTIHFPSKEEKLVFDEEKSYCNNGVSINWSYQLWTANIEFQNYEIQNKERTYCNLYFKTREEYTFDYTGSEQEFVVPKDGYYQVELWGASVSTDQKAEGAYTSGIIPLSKNEKLYFYVGQKGQLCNPYTLCSGEAFNGGGSGGFFTSSVFQCRVEGGAGATDVRIKNGLWNDFASLKSRIMVSSGGAYLVPAGGITGYSSDVSVTGGAKKGSGATQTSGGIASSNATNGKFGIGGKGYVSYPDNPNINSGFGGSGGYYGGGGGSGGVIVSIDGENHMGYGGSGSSFISGHNGCDAIKEESTSNNIIHTGQPNHYSEYIFTETKMIDGNGYLWTDTKLGLEAMPNPSGGYYDLGVGHTGNGFARVTYLGR